MFAFESTAGTFHYLVCPYKDNFYLNSLEKLNFWETMYRLLREQGYRRVISYELLASKNQYTIQAYDRLSYYSYMYPVLFEQLKLKGIEIDEVHDTEEIAKLFDNAASSTVASNTGLQGMSGRISRNQVKQEAIKQDYKHIASTVEMKDLSNEMQNRLYKALNTKRIKTAVLFPVALFLEVKVAIDVVKLFEQLKTDKNVIVFYTDTDFCSIKNLDFLKQDFAGDNNDEILGNLSRRGVYHQAQPCTLDEVRNLILRKKIIDNDPSVRNIPFNKIEAVASKILERKGKLGNINAEWNPERPLSSLDARLSNSNFSSALVDDVKNIKPASIKPLSYFRGLDLERLGGIQLSFSDKNFEDIMQDMNEMIGMQTVKDRFRTLFDAQEILADSGESNMHIALIGNPGTGKTVCARHFANILYAMGRLKTNKFKEVKVADLISEHVGGSTAKTRKVCEEALDGVLFLDEAHNLVSQETTSSSTFPDTFHDQAFHELMTFMEDHRNRICVVVAGYPIKMQRFFDADAGMNRRLPESRHITLPDYSPEELFAIFELFAKREKFKFDEAFCIAIRKIIKQKYDLKNEDFGNAGEMRNLFEACRDMYVRRIAKVPHQNRDTVNDFIFTIEDIPEEFTKSHDSIYNKVMKELDELIGLQNVKEKIKSLAAIKRQEKRLGKDGGKQEPGNYLFKGSPGTGKTEVARLMGRILLGLGILSKGHVVKVTPGELIAGYVRQSAIQARQKCKEALGGVLFIDEAYGLQSDSQGANFGKEAFDAIMEFMEENRHRICVIMAGYPEDMDRLSAMNDGFSSRKEDIIFEGYNPNELMQILALMIDKEGLIASEEFQRDVRQILQNMWELRTRSFANARECRILLRNAKQKQALRLVALEDQGEEISDEQARTLLPEDLKDYLKYLTPSLKSKSAFAALNRNEFLQHVATRPSFPYASENPDEFFAANQDALLYIRTDKGHGSGFLVSPDGYALTCEHVVRGAVKIEARLHVRDRDFWQPCEVLKAENGLDIALIRINDWPEYPYMKLALPERKIQRDESFTIIGYPFGAKLEAGYANFRGTIASGGEHKDGQWVKFLINGEAKSGNSGSPIIAHDGTVIGLLLGSLLEKGKNLTEEVNYLRPISYFWSEFTQ